MMNDIFNSDIVMPEKPTIQREFTTRQNLCAVCTHLKAGALHSVHLKVHKREKFFSSDFEFFTILYLVKLKY